MQSVYANFNRDAQKITFNYPLTVNGNITGSNIGCSNITSSNITNTGDIDIGGKVGIGTTGHPNFKLYVNGNTYINGTLNFNNGLNCQSILNNESTTSTAWVTSLLGFGMLTNSKYAFRAVCFYNSASINTGSKWRAYSYATTNVLRQRVTWTTTSTTQNIFSSDALSANPTVSTSSLTSGNIAEIIGYVEVGYDEGPTSLNIEYSSEVAGSAITLLAGSFIEYRKL